MNRQGQGPSTLDKERQFAAMLEMEIQIVRKRCPRSIFRYVDLNAGSGWNHQYSVAGSPTVFVELAEELLGRRWHAYLFERNEQTFEELSQRFNGHPRVTLFREDNARLMEAAKRFLTGWDIGCVLVDPNCWMYRNQNGEGAPVAQLIDFMKKYRRMDLIANLNGRTYKLQRGAFEKGLATYSNFHGLGDNCSKFLQLFNKSHGLISTLSSNGHSHFVRLVLRNIPTRDFRAWGWFHLDSPEAQQVYQWLETSNGNLTDEDQMKL